MPIYKSLGRKETKLYPYFLKILGYGQLVFTARKGRSFFMSEMTREDYLARLRAVAAKENRLPQKSDFSVEDVNRIKGFFGPWPWALEAAGLKDSKQEQRRQKNYEKRRRSRARRASEKNIQKGEENNV